MQTAYILDAVRTPRGRGKAGKGAPGSDGTVEGFEVKPGSESVAAGEGEKELAMRGDLSRFELTPDPDVEGAGSSKEGEGASQSGDGKGKEEPPSTAEGSAPKAYRP